METETWEEGEEERRKEPEKGVEGVGVGWTGPVP